MLFLEHVSLWHARVIRGDSRPDVALPKGQEGQFVAQQCHYERPTAPDVSTSKKGQTPELTTTRAPIQPRNAMRHGCRRKVVKKLKRLKRSASEIAHVTALALTLESDQLNTTLLPKFEIALQDTSLR